MAQQRSARNFNSVLIKHDGTSYAVDPKSVGSGSYGSFHRATYSENGQIKNFGVKFIQDNSRPNSPEEKAVYDKAVKEAQIANLLQDGVVVASSSEVQQTSLNGKKFPKGVFVFQPFLEGTPLDRIPQKELSKLSTTDRLGLVAQLVDQLNILHNANISHFDLKSDNVLVDLKATPPRLHLVDFGMSEHTPDHKSFKAWNRTGNPQYYAPEGFKMGDWYGVSSKDITVRAKPQIGMSTDVYMANNVILKLLGVKDPLSTKRFVTDQKHEKVGDRAVFSQDEIKKRVGQSFSLNGLINLSAGQLPLESNDFLRNFIARTEKIDPNARPTMAETADFYSCLHGLASVSSGSPIKEKEQEKSIYLAKLHLIDSGLWESSKKYSNQDLALLSENIVALSRKNQKEQLANFLTEALSEKITTADLIKWDSATCGKQIASAHPLEQTDLFQALQRPAVEKWLGKEKYSEVEQAVIRQIEKNANHLPPFECVQYLSSVNTHQRHSFLGQLDATKKSALSAYLNEVELEQIFPKAEQIKAQLDMLQASAAPKKNSSYGGFFAFFKPTPTAPLEPTATSEKLEVKKNKMFLDEAKEHFPLHDALRTQDWDKASNLIRSGKQDLNKEDNFGNTPLHLAVSAGEEEIVELLINRGVHLNEQNMLKETPLHISVTHEDIGISTLLIDAGAKVNIENADHRDVRQLLQEMSKKPLQEAYSLQLLEKIDKLSPTQDDDSQSVLGRSF